LGTIPGLDVHWGLLYGVLFCVAAYILMDHSTFGFAARVARVPISVRFAATDPPFARSPTRKP
jgi:ABC-type uncharacterized transport system permease subunit